LDIFCIMDFMESLTTTELGHRVNPG